MLHQITTGLESKDTRTCIDARSERKVSLMLEELVNNSKIEFDDTLPVDTRNRYVRATLTRCS